MTTTVARRYRFTARHSVPGLPAPWCEPHQHDYTVEVQAVAMSRDPLIVVIDTDKLDATWQTIAKHIHSHGRSLDAAYGAPNTTVEALAHRWLADFQREHKLLVQRVTVWEDDDRWGSATR